MKRYILLILILALCLAACVSCKGKEAPAESTPAETIPPAVESIPEESEPSLEPCNHDFSKGWSQNELYHWQECTICGADEAIAVHVDELAFVGLAPTETEDGYGFYICEVCGRMEKRDIPAGTELEIE